jgi:ABC-type branched-subunit amino acid transport system substrate-binding protein
MYRFFLCTLVFCLFGLVGFAEEVKIGLNYPKTGPYSVQGIDQLNAAELAVEEINAKGGILGKKVVLVIRDSQSKDDVSKENAKEMIDKEGVKMIFGGSSSGVAIAVGKICNMSNIPFFGTLTYSTATTGEEAGRTIFRACYDSWAAAKVLADYMKKNFDGKKYFYITADYTWGHTTEAAFRKFTGTEDTSVHKGVKTPFPGASPENFAKAIKIAQVVNPDVLILVLFGEDMVQGIQEATKAGIKAKTQIVVPNLTLGMAESAGLENMEGVLGALDWAWRIPELTNSASGKEFVKNFSAKYNRYPCCSGGAAYTILYEYKAAVERAKSFDTAAIISALEGSKFTLLKDEQVWRAFDHQCVQTVYAVKCKPAAEVLKDPFKLDFFEIINSLPGEKAFRTQEEWNKVREEVGKPTKLE